MKKIKILIIGVIIIIIILILMILFGNIVTKEEEKQQNIEGDPGEEVEFSENQLETVTDKVKFYTVINCLQQYYDYLNVNNESYYGRGNQGEQELLISREELLQIIYNLLSKEFIEVNKITIDNINQFVNFSESKINFIPLKMQVIKNSIVEKYIVYGIEENTNNEFIKYSYFIVNMDNENGTFSIEPIDQVENFEAINTTNKNIEIEKNENNVYETAKISYEYSATKYMDIYKKLVLGVPEEAYNLLDEEYKTKRFGNVNNFIEYINKNKEEISNTQCLKYLVNEKKDSTEYVCMDQYNNYYIFNENLPIDIKIKLDNSIIDTETFIETYNSSSTENKVMLNIDKWIKIINTRNYHNSYEILDETFRNNYFNTEEKFEQYMTQNFAGHYTAEYSGFDESSNIFSMDVSLTDIETGDKKEITIIMQLKEGTDFVMSFSIS